MTPEEISIHIKLFGRSCFNCDNLCADDEEYTIHTKYWCSKYKGLRMNREGSVNCWCRNNWTFRDDSN